MRIVPVAGGRAPPSTGFLEPGGPAPVVQRDSARRLLYLRDVVFSFEASEYKEFVEKWLGRMPTISGFLRQDFEIHVREEYGTFAWVLEGLLERAGFDIIEREYPAPEYAEYLCSPRKSAV